MTFPECSRWPDPQGLWGWRMWGSYTGTQSTVIGIASCGRRPVSAIYTAQFKSTMAGFRTLEDVKWYSSTRGA